MRWKPAALAFLIGGGFAGSASADEFFCNAYADEAVATAITQSQVNCHFKGDRWSTDRAVHFNACMKWGEDKVNGGMAAMNEFSDRTVDLANCWADRIGLKHINDEHVPFKGDDASTFDNFCRAYAYIAKRQVIAGPPRVSECGYQGDRWTDDFDVHLNLCLGWAENAGKTAAAQNWSRTRDKLQCAAKLENAKAGPAPAPAEPAPDQPAGKTVTVLQSVDVYAAKGGEGDPTGTLEEGTAGVTLVEPCSDSWCHVKWPAGEGWVYDAADFDSLSIP